jgi:hypothetical protein
LRERGVGVGEEETDRKKEREKQTQVWLRRDRGRISEGLSLRGTEDQRQNVEIE